MYLHPCSSAIAGCGQQRCPLSYVARRLVASDDVW
jgi:hypothetical protein